MYDRIQPAQNRDRILSFQLLITSRIWEDKPVNDSLIFYIIRSFTLEEAEMFTENKRLICYKIRSRPMHNDTDVWLSTLLTASGDMISLSS